jgi:hypothetical protein
MSVEDRERRTGEEDGLKDLAEKLMDDKREDGSSETRTRELYDVPSASSVDLSESQDPEAVDEG